MVAMRFWFICGLLCLFFSACEKTDPSTLPFTKIYDDQNGNRSFTPLAIAKATLDHGYFVLSAYDGWRIQLMKIDKEGNFEWNLFLPEQYVNASPSILTIDNVLYLVCMDPVQVDTRILRIDEVNMSVSQIAHLEEVTYPIHAHYTGDKLYLLNAPLSSQMMGIHEVSQALDTVVKGGALSISMNVDDLLLKHMMHRGTRWPFYVQSSPEKDLLCVNAFYNYSFSSVFMDSDLQFNGVINGAGLEGGLLAMAPLGQQKFAFARKAGDLVLFNPMLAINPSTVAMATALEAQGDAELDPTKPVILKDITHQTVSYKMLFESTRSNQLILKHYDASGKKVGSRYLSKNVPIKACDAIQTPYGEVLILAQVRVMGSFNRIATIKLTPTNLQELLQP